MQSVKETAANIAASALSGMEKTKAVIEEKAEKISTSDPMEKDMATMKKEDRIRQAELRKQEAYEQNAAAAAANTGGYTATADVPNTKPVSTAVAGHGTEVQSTMPTVRPAEPVGHVVEGVYGGYMNSRGGMGSQFPVGTGEDVGIDGGDSTTGGGEIGGPGKYR